jgi:alpha-tubulin suppressor-like RCC1 family protein
MTVLLAGCGAGHTFPKSKGAGKPIEVATSGSHSCALMAGGAVECWGSNELGELGLGGAIGEPYARATPAPVKGLSGRVRQVATSIDVTCALNTEGGLECWGGNRAANLGDGTKVFARTRPGDVAGLTTGVVSVSDGATCALLRNGDARCWGANTYGQLGDGTGVGRRTSVRVSLRDDVRALSGEGISVCALMTSGTVRCWGDNTIGELGDGTTRQRLTPVRVRGLKERIVAIAVGDGHACALTKLRTVLCWGRGGALGDGTKMTHRAPTPVVDLNGRVAAIAAGGAHTCALMQGGPVKCWGLNANGELGDGTTVSRLTPVTVKRLGGRAVRIAAGALTTCAVLRSGTVKCWGQNDSGQLGDGTVTDRHLPVRVIGLGSPAPRS